MTVAQPDIITMQQTAKITLFTAFSFVITNQKINDQIKKGWHHATLFQYKRLLIFYQYWKFHVSAKPACHDQTSAAVVVAVAAGDAA